MEESQGRFRPVVSVLIVNFNCGQLLSAAVRAVLASPVSLEIIVADNGSSDDSLASLRSRFGTHPRVRIIENGENLGFARAHNRILRQSRGEGIVKIKGRITVNPKYWLRHAGLVSWWSLGRV